MLHIKTLKPLFTSILVTGEEYAEDIKDNGIITYKKGDLKLYQTVLAVGSSVRDIKVGDQIMFNPKDYAVMKYDPNSVKNDFDMNKAIRWNFPWVFVDDEEGKPQRCLLLKDRDIEFVFEGEEVNESIILPDKPTFILN